MHAHVHYTHAWCSMHKIDLLHMEMDKKNFRFVTCSNLHISLSVR